MIFSPVKSICVTDSSTGYCYGCTRIIKEKRTWKQPENLDKWKENNIKEIKNDINL